MQDYKIEITKKQYEQYNEMSYSERSQIIEDMLPQSIVCGYGYYGHRLEHIIDMKEMADKYYIVCRIGNSCD